MENHLFKIMRKNGVHDFRSNLLVYQKGSPINTPILFVESPWTH